MYLQYIEQNVEAISYFMPLRFSGFDLYKKDRN